MRGLPFLPFGQAPHFIMADETKKREQDFRLVPGQPGRLRILLSQRPSPAEEDMGGPDEEDDSGGVLPSTTEEDDLIPAHKDSIQVFDLGTYLTVEGQNEYHDFNGYVARAATGQPSTYGGLPTFFGDFREDDLAALDSMLLGSLRSGASGRNPLDSIRAIGGRTSPNVLKLNHNADIPPIAYDAALDLYTGAGERVQVGKDDESAWKWRGTNLSGEHWAASNLEFHLAPASGKFVRKGRKRTYARVVCSDDDARYWPFDTASAGWRVTDTPEYTGAEVPLALKFPLRVFLAPALWESREAEGGAAIVGPSITLARAVVAINEFGIHTAARLTPALFPFVNEHTQDRWLSAPELMLLTRRELTYYWPGQPLTTDITYYHRRPFWRTALQMEALDLGRASYSSDDWYPYSASGFAAGEDEPLSFGRGAQKAGHLSAVIVSRRKAYYVWRAA